jgi:hypothetical protein
MHRCTSGGCIVVIYTHLLNVVTESGVKPVDNRGELALQSLMVVNLCRSIAGQKLLIAGSFAIIFTY